MFQLLWAAVWLLARSTGTLACQRNILETDEGRCTETDFYTAAVYEHVRREAWGRGTFADIVSKNLEVFEEVSAQAAQENVDLLVFPEYGLMPAAKHKDFLMNVLETIPEPGINACAEGASANATMSVLYHLSCMAKRHKIVIVANVGSKQPCDIKTDESCPPDFGAWIFNTAVALDREGTLLARYFKHHLFFEYGFDEPPKKNYSIFKTDFGKFGIFICFDIMYPEAARLVEDHGIKNVIFPNWWYDELPMNQALQTQASWAYRFDVNLLGANVHHPFTGSLGSGIFSGRMGSIISTHVNDSHPRLLIASIPKDPRRCRPTVYHTKEIVGTVDPDTKEHLYTKYHYMNTNLKDYSVVRLEESHASFELCNNGLCCHLAYRAGPGGIRGTFYFAVFRGIRSIKAKYFIYEENCFVAECTSRAPGTCTRYPLQGQSLFNELKLSGNFSTPYVHPSVMAAGNELVSTSKWSYCDNTLWYSDSNSSLPIISFVLYGRVYNKDMPTKPRTS